MGPRNLVPAREKSAATRNAGETGSSFGRARYHSAHARSPRSCCRSLHPRRVQGRPPRPRRTSRSRRCAGATSAPRVRDAPARWRAFRTSRTPSTPASTTAASGDRRTTAPTGCRSSTISRPDRSAPSPSLRRTRTSSTSAPAPASSAPIWRLATASTSPPTPGARGSTSDCATVR